MAVEVSCSSCGKSYRVTEDKLGQRVACKGCGKTFTLAAAPGPSIEIDPLLQVAAKMEAGAQYVDPSQKCPLCSAQISPGTQVCVECGYSARHGKLRTSISKEGKIFKPLTQDAMPGATYAGGNSALLGDKLREAEAQEAHGWTNFGVSLAAAGVVIILLSILGPEVGRLTGAGDSLPHIGLGLGLLGALMLFARRKAMWGGIAAGISLAALLASMIVTPTMVEEKIADATRPTAVVEPTVTPPPNPALVAKPVVAIDSTAPPVPKRKPVQERGEDSIQFLARVLSSDTQWSADAGQDLLRMKIPVERQAEVRAAFDTLVSHPRPEMRALGRRGVMIVEDDHTIDTLIGGANDPDTGNAVAALRELGRLKAERAIAAIFEQIGSHPAAVEEALASFGPYFQSDIHEAAVLALSSPNAETRVGVVRYCVKHCPEKAGPKLLEMLRDDPETRTTTLEPVMTLMPEKAVPILFEQADAASLGTLHRKGIAAAKPALLKLLDGRSEANVLSAIKILADLKLAEAEPRLYELARPEASAAIRKSARAALRTISPDEFTTAREARIDLEFSTAPAPEAIRLLAAAELPQNPDALARTLDALYGYFKRFPEARADVDPLFVKWQRARFVDALIAEVKTSKNREPRAVAMYALASTQDPRAAQTILDAWIETDTPTAAKAISRLGAGGEDLVIRMLLSKDDLIARRGCSALELIGSRKALLQLTALSRNAERPTLNQYAKNALEKVRQRIKAEDETANSPG